MTVHLQDGRYRQALQGCGHGCEKVCVGVSSSAGDWLLWVSVDYILVVFIILQSIGISC